MPIRLGAWTHALGLHCLWLRHSVLLLLGQFLIRTCLVRLHTCPAVYLSRVTNHIKATKGVKVAHEYQGDFIDLIKSINNDMCFVFMQVCLYEGHLTCHDTLQQLNVQGTFWGSGIQKDKIICHHISSENVHLCSLWGDGEETCEMIIIKEKRYLNL